MIENNLPPGSYTVNSNDVIFDVKDGHVNMRLKPDAKLTPIAPKPPAAPMRRVRRDPLEGHPRAEETRQAMLQARFDDEQEVVELQSSELACAVADVWADDRMGARAAAVFDAHLGLARALDRLELVTRASALRKVRP